MKIGDKIKHRTIGPCEITHIWMGHLGVVPVNGGDTEMITIPENSAMEEKDITKIDQPSDAYGEVLEAGDVVITASGVSPGEVRECGYISNLAILGDWCERREMFHTFHVPGGVEGVVSKRCHVICSEMTKLHTLTRDQYLPLARRTLDDEMRTNDRLRLSYLAVGLYDEMLEFADDQSVDEAGDVLWYAEQLIDELESRNIGSYNCGLRAHSRPKVWTESIKKGAFYLDEGYLEVLLSGAVRAVGWVSLFARGWGGDDYNIGHIRLENIKKLYRRHPDGWKGLVSG